MKFNKNNRNDFLNDDHRLTSYLSDLLHKVLRYHDVDGLPQMVLHEIGHKNGFGLKRATYLVDNPDFNHLLGVAGYCNKECCYHKDDLWKNPCSFVGDMKDAEYHNNVKSFLHDSLRKKEIDLKNPKDIKELGNDLGIDGPRFFSWNMKHGNHGLLIFENPEKPLDEWKEKLFSNIAALLSFCGI
ncbi:hypothetical protein KAT08_02475 [Candidatus Babeliales bacterium]|nr:hypothetical protein [Candidatus Babeliales bacterium]